LRHQRPERVGRVMLYPLKRGGGIDIPEQNGLMGASPRQHRRFQFGIENPDAAELDHDIGIGSVP
jgi:hypothetical protein